MKKKKFTTNLQINTNIRMGEQKIQLIYPELSYKIIGVLYDVYNTIGYGYQEKYYYKAIRTGLEANRIALKEQVHVPLTYKNTIIGGYFIDFVIENKIVLEIKKGNHFSKTNIEQVYAYLESTGMKLGILANFTSDGIKFKRILNLDSYIRKNP
jgi:GxxExxY protein